MSYIMLHLGIKLLTLFNLLFLSSADNEKPCTKYTTADLAKNAKAAPIVIQGLAVASIPYYLNETDSRYFGYTYDAEIFIIEVYKGHELVAKAINFTNYNDTTLFSMKNTRLNLTGFYKPQDRSKGDIGYEKNRCWQPVTTGTFYFMFLELNKLGKLSAYKDDERGAFSLWSEDNFTTLWPALGWSEWSDWSICSDNCGAGTQVRWRYCERQEGCPTNWNKERRTCNDFPCEGVVNPLEIKSEDYFHPLRKQWEPVPGRESAWHMKKGSHLWLPGNEVAFPKLNFQSSCSLLISLRVHANGSQQGTILSLRSRRDNKVFLSLESLELFESQFIRLVHSSNNTVGSYIFPVSVGDGKWHQIGIGIQNDNRILTYVDCNLEYTYSYNPEYFNKTDHVADLVLGYLFTGDIEQILLVPNSDAFRHQCNSSSVIKFLDREFLKQTKISFPPTKIPPELSDIDRMDLRTTLPPEPTEEMDYFFLTSFLTSRHTIANTSRVDKKRNDPRYVDEYREMMRDEPARDVEFLETRENNLGGKRPEKKGDNTGFPKNLGGKGYFSEKEHGNKNSGKKSTVRQEILGKDWGADEELFDNEPGDVDMEVEGSGVQDDVMYEIEWSIWSKCSAPCGRGTQTRHSKCVDTDLLKLELCLQSGDERVESRACNPHPCVERQRHEGRRDMVHSLMGNHYVEEGSLNNNDVTNCPCLNGASCLNSEPKSVWPFLKVELWRRCKCLNGYTGKLCETPICTEPCANGGICIRPDVCYCSKMFTGTTCQKPICNPRCENNGECVRPGVCSCKSGFKHPHCKPICPRDCGPNGFCSAPGQCTCYSGYRGLHCGERILCAQVCANGGVCVRENVCRCQSGWTGDDCSIAMCELSCKNGGVCVAPNICSCPSGFSGPQCNISICRSEGCFKNYSADSLETSSAICNPPCQNGGTCASNNVCICIEITGGHRCETKKCKVRPVQEPFTRGFRRVARSHSKCRNNNLRLCVKQFPHYETVYKTYYQTQFKCIED